MEPFIALSAYDIFVYLLVGIAALAACDLVRGTHFIFRQDWSPGVTTMVVILGYLMGQIVSWPAEVIFQDVIVARAIDWPAVHLVPPLDPEPKAEGPICAGARNPPRPAPSKSSFCLQAFRALTGHYSEPLSWSVQQRIRRKAPFNETTCKIDYEAMYIEAFAATKKDPNAFERASTFARLEVFCRNMACVALFASLFAFYNVGLASHGVHRRPIPGVQPWLNNPRLQLALFLVVGVGLFLRFIYFFRLQAVEVLTTYAYVPLPID